jgi:formylglycine-generating enzyme required for sulfatase activity
MTLSLPGKKGFFAQVGDICKSVFMPEKYRQDRQAETAIATTTINSENAAKQRELQGNIAALQALQHKASLDVQREQGDLNRELQQDIAQMNLGFQANEGNLNRSLQREQGDLNRGLQKYLAEMNIAFQANEGRLNRELQDNLARLNREFQAHEGKLNREHAAKMEVFRAELQKWCIAQQRQLQLELKQLDALLAREIAIANRETAIAAIVKQKNLENSPILVTAENIITNINPDDIPVLRVFLSPPVLTHDPAKSNQNFPVSEEFLSNYLRNFLNQYTNEGRPVQFMGGSWRSNVFREEAAAENLFAGLRVIPTLILDSSTANDDFYLRFGFWHINFKKYRYKTPIHQLPWVEVLYNFAKQRALNWQAKRQAHIDAGKPVADFDTRYGEETVKRYQQNLRTLEIERVALEEGEDLSEIHRPYHLHKNDYNDLAEFIGICHALIAGLMADEYCLMFLPPALRKTPLLPQLLPDILAKLPADEQNLVTEIVVGYCQALYDNLAEEESALIPDLRLDLAESLLSLPDKKWAAAQLYLSVQDWLKLHGLPIPQQNQLLNALSAALTIDDLSYITKLNQCLQRLGATRQLSVIESCWQRGLQRAKNGEYSSAITDFHQVLQLDSSRLEANIQRGLAYYHIAEYQGAIADFDLVLRLNPNDASVYHHRGLVYRKLGQLERAIQDFNYALQINPSLPGVLHIRDVALGVLEERKREAEEEASKGKPFIFEIITVDGNGKQNKKSGKGYQKEQDLGNGVKLEMVYIPAGNFMMGSPSGEGESNEYSQHPVTIAKPFYLGKYPVTQEQYQAVMGNNPSNFKGAKRPVEQVSWRDAVAFCQKLSEETGNNYRLPSEAEWEYACRAETTTAYCFGETLTNELANFNSAIGQTTDVGKYPPNAFGLYDMHGNVWEWCADPWHSDYGKAPTDGSVWDEKYNDNRYQNSADLLTKSGNDDTYRLLRGGSWYYYPRYCPSAFRYSFAPDTRNDYSGFRFVCVWLRGPNSA